jgi:tetratricopeptide (TPR) repeat protein
MAFLMLEQPARAVADLTEALRRGANYEARNDRGVAHLRAGDYEAAVADFNAAIPLSPAPLEIIHNRGVAYASLGRTEEALADFSHVLAENPRAVKTWIVRGNLWLTVRADRDAACADWREACRLGECRYFRAHCSGSP